MNASQILQSDLLDIVFEGKNKMYGAYELRRNYNRRIKKSLLLMGALILLIMLLRSFRSKPVEAPNGQWVGVAETKFTNYKEKEQPERNIKLPVLRSQASVAKVKYNNIRIVKDAEATVPPPDIKQLEGAKIAIETVRGVLNDDIISPPEAITGTGVIGAPDNKKRDEADEVVIHVDVQASFPGGVNAWMKYVQKSIEKELPDFTDADYGTCIVKFIVDKTGKVSDVQATTMKGTRLAEIAVNAIRSGPRWVPAQQNGHYVNAYRLQPVTLKRIE